MDWLQKAVEALNNAKASALAIMLLFGGGFLLQQLVSLLRIVLGK